MTSFALSFGTMCQGMKKIMSVSFAWPDIPCARHPSLFPYEWVHVALALGFAMRCQYSNSLPFLPMMEFAISQNQIIGNLQVTNFAGGISNVGLVISMHASIASCMIRCSRLAIVPSLWFILVVLQDVIWPRGGGLLSPLSRGCWLNNLQSGSLNLRQWPCDRGLVSPLLQGRILNNLHSTTHTPYATIFQCWSGLHPWKGCGQWRG
jgi:hypothetical protein